MAYSSNRGPLTTVFTPPTNCLATTTFFSSEYFLGKGYDVTGQESCYPKPTTSRTDFGNYPLLYSPGICPSGYDYVFPCKSFRARNRRRVV